MRRLTAAVLGVLCLLAGASSTASSANSDNAQRWLLLSKPGEPTKVVATGTINAQGTAVDVLTLHPDGTFDNDATQMFPDGTLLEHSSGTFTFKLDPKTCHAKGDVVGTFVVTGGTGAYAGATGQGVSSSLTFFYDKTPTGCSPVQSRVNGIGHAEGTLDLP